MRKENEWMKEGKKRNQRRWNTNEALFGDFTAGSGEFEGAVAVARRRTAPKTEMQEGW